MAKNRINVSLDVDLAEFIKYYADLNRTTVADIFTQYVLTLKRMAQDDTVFSFLSSPVFRKALGESQEKIRSGKAKWHSYEEVFGEE